MGEAKCLDDKKVAKRNTTRRIRKKFITKNVKKNIILSYHIRFKRFVRDNIADIMLIIIEMKLEYQKYKNLSYIDYFRFSNCTNPRKL